MKTIEDISLVDMQVEKLVNNFYNVKRISRNSVETFFIHGDSFLYKVENFNGEAELGKCMIIMTKEEFTK